MADTLEDLAARSWKRPDVNDWLAMVRRTPWLFPHSPAALRAIAKERG